MARHPKESHPLALQRSSDRLPLTAQSGDSDEHILLRILITQRHWQKFSTFERKFQHAATELAESERDSSLRTLTVSPRQFERWYAGGVKTKPRLDTCRVLEHLFGYSVDQLFSPASWVSRQGKDETQAASITQNADEHSLLWHPLHVSILPGGNLPGAAAVPLMSALSNVLAGYVHADQMSGALFLIDAVRKQVPIVEKISEVTRGSDRVEALRFGSRFMEFCGWLHHDAGDLVCAMHWTNKALDYALELGDQREVAYILMRKAGIATESGNPRSGLGMANTALVDADALTPRLRAVILRQRAYSHALLEESDEATKDTENAISEATVGIDQDEDDRAPYCTPTYIEMEAGASIALLGDPSAALPILEQSRSNWSDPGQIRDYALCLSRLATAYAATDERERACDVAEQAIKLAQSLGSYRVVSQLKKLRRQLTKWSRDPNVAKLMTTLNAFIDSFQSAPSQSEGSK